LNDTKVGRESRLFCDFDYISGFNVVFIRLVAKIKKAASPYGLAAFSQIKNFRWNIRLVIL